MGEELTRLEIGLVLDGGTMLISHETRNLVTDRIRRLFGGNPCRVQVAALPWREREGRVEILLVTSRGTRRWIIPKGWPEASETLSQSAARETSEEAGVTGVVAGHPAGRYFYGKAQPGGLSWRCEVAVFPLEVTLEADKWPEKKQRSRRWVSPDEAAHLVEEPDLGELIRRFGRDPRGIAA